MYQLSEEFRGVEEEAEVDANVPVVGWIGEVVAVERETGEGEVVDGGYLTDEFCFAEPSVVAGSLSIRHKIPYRRIYIEIPSQLEFTYRIPNRNQTRRNIIVGAEGFIEIVLSGWCGSKCCRMYQSCGIILSQVLQRAHGIRHHT